MWGQARRAAEAEICTQRLRVQPEVFFGGRVVYGVVQKKGEMDSISSCHLFS